MTSIRGRIMNKLIEIRKHWQIYVLILLPITWYILFAYAPMGGLILAFKTYKAKLGILGSPWAGFANFEMVFRDPAFYKALWRTFEINVVKLLITFPAPIILAILFSEVRLKRGRKMLQTVYTYPNFLSWVIVAAILQNLLASRGIVNTALAAIGLEKINFLGNPKLIKPLLYVSDIWKSAGYSAIIFMSAITAIEQDQYEAAELDGATRMQRIWNITIPSIMPTIAIMFILQTGNLMSGGFDQVFNLANAATKSVVETLDIYIYRITFLQSPDFGFSTAVSLFRSVINLFLLLTANYVSQRLTGNALIFPMTRKNKKGDAG